MLSSTKQTYIAEAKTAKIWMTTLVFAIWRLIATTQQDKCQNTLGLDPNAQYKLT